MNSLAQFPPMIIKWAQAIAHWEAALATSFNPGNLKYSSLTASWGATRGRPAADGGFFCQFQNETQGMVALCHFLMLGCENLLLAFHKARTLGQFTVVFAGGPPQGYINGIQQMLGVPLTTNIATFLTA